MVGGWVDGRIGGWPWICWYTRGGLVSGPAGAAPHHAANTLRRVSYLPAAVRALRTTAVLLYQVRGWVGGWVIKTVDNYSDRDKQCVSGPPE